MAFLDDIHIATPEPDRVIEAHTVVAEELWSHARIQVHLGKTQVWNRGGIEPAGMDGLTRAARLVKPDAIVWKGDPQLPPLQQGLKVLGVPLGQPEFIKEFLQRKSGELATLFERIPWVNDPQAAYLLLPPHVRVYSSQFLVESDQSRFDRGVCHAPRRRCVEMLVHNPRYAIGSRGCEGPRFIVLLLWRFGVSECPPAASSSPFRQLGRQSPDGEETPPSHRSDHGQKSRGGYHSNFRSRARMQRFSGGGWS